MSGRLVNSVLDKNSNAYGWGVDLRLLLLLVSVDTEFT